MKTKAKEIEEALKHLLESCDEVTIEPKSEKASVIQVTIRKRNMNGVDGYIGMIHRDGEWDESYFFVTDLFGVAEKIESGDF